MKNQILIEFICKKHEKVSRVLNYIVYLLILVSTVTEWVSVSVFPSLAGVPIGITSFPVGLKICVKFTGVKKSKSINKKEKKSIIK